MNRVDSLLDNPSWQALITEQAAFAQGNGQARRYRPGILPFTGFAAASAAATADLDPFLHPGETFYIIGELPPLPPGWTIETLLPCAQLLAPLNISCLPQPKETIITHPDYTGHGYAQQLIGLLCRRQTSAGIMPFLHVSLSNQRALRLYIHLGFRHRRDIVFRRLRKSLTDQSFGQPG